MCSKRAIGNSSIIVRVNGPKEHKYSLWALPYAAAAGVDAVPVSVAAMVVITAIAVVNKRGGKSSRSSSSSIWIRPLGNILFFKVSLTLGPFLEFPIATHCVCGFFPSLSLGLLPQRCVDTHVRTHSFPCPKRSFRIRNGRSYSKTAVSEFETTFSDIIFVMRTTG